MFPSDSTDSSSRSPFTTVFFVRRFSCLFHEVHSTYNQHIIFDDNLFALLPTTHLGYDLDEVNSAGFDSFFQLRCSNNTHSKLLDLPSI